MGPQFHGVNHKKLTFLDYKNHDFKQLSCLIWANDQPPLGIISHILHNQSELNCVKNVRFGNSMPVRRRMNLHTRSL